MAETVQNGSAKLWPRRRLLALGGAAALAGAGGLWLRAQPPRHGQPRLGTEQAWARVQAGTVLLVDIRRPEEWRATGVPAGSRPIDMRRADFAAAVRAASGAADLPVALICARGVRSARMVRALAAEGLPTIADVPEGMLGSAAGPGWIARGLPVVPWRA
ncbi:rhodanese-like domain-containing protein [Cribrihabitans neustonicus]|uniref:rhodanese-like domain-containing protein n=1 Tax=Cribrihabitans neustonicus TaxID=1429085 RepID=UPI003B5B825A